MNRGNRDIMMNLALHIIIWWNTRYKLCNTQYIFVIMCYRKSLDTPSILSQIVC